jgi:hypothetical protein
MSVADMLPVMIYDVGWCYSPTTSLTLSLCIASAILKSGEEVVMAALVVPVSAQDALTATDTLAPASLKVPTFWLDNTKFWFFQVGAHKLIHHPGLGDQRPSHLMDQMLAILLPTTIPKKVFIGLFMDRLPVEISVGLSQYDFSEPRTLVANADLV